MNYKKILKNGTAIFLAIGLMYYVFEGQDINSIWSDIKNADLTWVYVSIAISLVGNIARSWRWQILLKDVGYRVPLIKSLMAVLAGYFANLIIPRLGEVTRCTLLKKDENVDFSPAFGTVITERIADLFILILVSIATILYQYETLSPMLEKFSGGFAEFFANLDLLYLFLVIIGLLSLIVIIYLILTKTQKGKAFREKIKSFLSEVVRGIGSIKKSGKDPSFWISTAIIWVCYFFMSYVIFWSIPATSNLGVGAGMAVLIGGGIGMSVPVQGGFGSYHAVVAFVLGLYDISEQKGLSMATLLHSSQVFFIFLFGGISLLISFAKGFSLADNDGKK
ncbi:MAG: flippase-like domain-containing protein [Cyclobacteriaceae bacterium]|nr:flippase-like domain-containing protein [Cyclobacteriaceae bacterium]MCH8517168.1 flippase-like domain-containing protein [Cyclobacteriaceae bacterium]